jgi:hypothetical protein
VSSTDVKTPKVHWPWITVRRPVDRMKDPVGPFRITLMGLRPWGLEEPRTDYRTDEVS